MKRIKYFWLAVFSLLFIKISRLFSITHHRLTALISGFKTDTKPLKDLLFFKTLPDWLVGTIKARLDERRFQVFWSPFDVGTLTLSFWLTLSSRYKFISVEINWFKELQSLNWRFNVMVLRLVIWGLGDACQNVIFKFSHNHRVIGKKSSAA